MPLHSKHPFKSIIVGSVEGVDLPVFTVLTGPNGTGKSNLLEALNSNNVVFDELGDLTAGQQVRMFALGQLLATVEGPAQGATYKEPWANLFNNVKNFREQAKTNAGLADDVIQQDQWINTQVISAKLLTQTALKRMEAETGKTLREMTLGDYKGHAPLIAGVKDPFAASIAEVFLSYGQRKSANEQAQWKLDTKGTGTALTDEEFEQRFGAPPWSLLDETLRLVGLPYSFVPPEDADSVNYEVVLNDEGNTQIKPADLSSGERVLLAIAMSLFTGSKMTEAIELPRLLLLDEADASLHPSMVKSLLTVVEEIFVKQYKVRVILTTHSPSTVALAPPEALWVMSRTGPKLRATTPDEALKLLTVGISSLSVKLENRRQVFVESEYDQAVYQNLFRILRPYISSDRSAEFIAAGKRDVGGGCDAVKRFVADLRGAGVDSVSGIVDRDNKQGTPDHIYYLDDRHSIENLLFDPLIAGAFLIRENIVVPEAFGLPAGIRAFDLKPEQAAALAAAVAAKLGFGSDTTKCKYVGDFEIEIASEFLTMRGHDLEALFIQTFPELNRFKSDLKEEIVNRAIADLPSFTPSSVVALLSDLLQD